MRIIVTGSLGNIGRPLVGLLIKKGQEVTVVSSDIKKQPAIEALGAKAAIGSLKDETFLTKTFAGADAVYAMIPMSFQEADQQTYMSNIAANYIKAIRAAGIKRLVLLSGWAADMLPEENTENDFTVLSDAGVIITILRPACFYTNFYFSMDMIRGKGLIGKYLTLRHLGLKALLTGKTGLLLGNFGAEDRVVFVSPKDIAEAAGDELLTNDPSGIRYVGSEEMTCNQAAQTIGKAIGKPWLKWIRISDKQMLQGLKMAKMPTRLAESMVQMQAAMHSGKTLENFHRNNPPMGRIKLADFAKEFANAYHKK